jgi:uncharacterized protein YukE
MTANSYPNLGWNPVPGVPEEVSALQRKVKSAAETLDNCHRQIERLLAASSSWQGDAASAFRDSLDGDLKEYMRNAGRSLGEAASRLAAWDGDLASHRDLARKYDEAAREKKAAVDKARRRRDEADKHPDLRLAGKEFPSQEEADAATARLRAAERALSEATAQLDNATTAYDDVIARARALEEEHGRRRTGSQGTGLAEQGRPGDRGRHRTGRPADLGTCRNHRCDRGPARAATDASRTDLRRDRCGCERTRDDQEPPERRFQGRFVGSVRVEGTSLRDRLRGR